MGCTYSKDLTCEEKQVPDWFSNALFNFLGLAIEQMLSRSNYDFKSLSVKAFKDLKPSITKITQMIWSEISELVNKKNLTSHDIIGIMSTCLTPVLVSKQIEKLGYTVFFEKSFPDVWDCHRLVYKHIEPQLSGQIFVFHFSECTDENPFPKCRIAPSERGKVGIKYGIVI